MKRVRLWSVLSVMLCFGAALPGDPARAADVARVGEGPFITGGGYFIAREKGYFKKLGIEIQAREFQDGATGGALDGLRRARHSPA